MKTKHVVLGVGSLGWLLLIADLNPGVAMAATDCGAQVRAAQAEWRSLSHGRAQVAPSQTIVTSDGQRLSGSAINYGRMLVGQAESACDAGHGDEAIAYVREALDLFHPAPRH